MLRHYTYIYMLKKIILENGEKQKKKRFGIRNCTLLRDRSIDEEMWSIEYIIVSHIYFNSLVKLMEIE